MPSRQRVSEVAPHPKTLERIKATIAKRDVRQLGHTEIKASNRLSAREFILACILITLIVLGTQVFSNLSPKPVSPDKLKRDCLAILVNESNIPILTILTHGNQGTLRLKWENWQLASNYKTQLWSQSRRDGLIKSLFVFDQPVSKTALTHEQFELIRDSSHLFIRQAVTIGSQAEKLGYELTAQGSCIPFSSNTPKD